MTFNSKRLNDDPFLLTTQKRRKFPTSSDSCFSSSPYNENLEVVNCLPLNVKYMADKLNRISAEFEHGNMTEEKSQLVRRIIADWIEYMADPNHSQYLLDKYNTSVELYHLYYSNK